MKKTYVKAVIVVITFSVVVLLLIASVIGLWLNTYGWQTVQFLLRAPMATRIEYTKNMFVVNEEAESLLPTRPTKSSTTSAQNSPTHIETPLPPTPVFWTIANMKHEYQKLNNCGPTSLAMAASAQGVEFSQLEAAEVVKGGGLDRNVSPSEMVAFLESKNLGAHYTVNGSTEVIEQLIAQNIPVIVHQWLVRRGDGELVGHYRVVRGYDKKKKIFITNDSFNGANFVIPYAQFDEWWRPFNRGYIPVYTASQTETVKNILGNDWSELNNLGNALDQALKEINSSHKDNYAYYNAGTSILPYEPDVAASYYDIAFKTEFPHLYLWYHYGHLEAYYKMDRYDEVIHHTDDLLKAAGEIEEARFWRAKVFAARGEKQAAIEELQKALTGNPRYTVAQDFLGELQK